MKRPGLDDTDYGRFFLSANFQFDVFIETFGTSIVARQMIRYQSSFDLLVSLLSGFRPGNSTETAILRVLSDILLAADRGDVSALILLDMTIAFDTVHHSILLQRLQSTFGICDTAIDGFSHTCPVVNSRFGVVPPGHLLTWSAACHRDLC